jgi:hypothetical protein
LLSSAIRFRIFIFHKPQREAGPFAPLDVLGFQCALQSRDCFLGGQLHEGVERRVLARSYPVSPLGELLGRPEGIVCQTIHQRGNRGLVAELLQVQCRLTAHDGIGIEKSLEALTRLGVTIISTVEVEENFTSMGLSNFTISFLADDIVRLRYASINGQLRKIMMVVKMRRSQHSIDMCAYEVTSKGLAIGEPMRGYRALTSGIPGPWSLESGEVPQQRTAVEGDNPNE